MARKKILTDRKQTYSFYLKPSWLAEVKALVEKLRDKDKQIKGVK